MEGHGATGSARFGARQSGGKGAVIRAVVGAAVGAAFFPVWAITPRWLGVLLGHALSQSNLSFSSTPEVHDALGIICSVVLCLLVPWTGYLVSRRLPVFMRAVLISLATVSSAFFALDVVIFVWLPSWISPNWPIATNWISIVSTHHNLWWW